MSNITKARSFIETVHKGQIRKYTGEPYYEHPVKVAQLILAVEPAPVDSDLIVAALLHDVVEDTQITIDTIEKEFGIVVACFVEQLTRIPSSIQITRAKRHQLYLSVLSHASSEVQTIKLADIIDNCPSIIKYDPKFAKVYMAENRELLLALQMGNSDLLDFANQIVNDFYK